MTFCFQLLAHYNGQIYITSNKVAKAINFLNHTGFLQIKQLSNIKNKVELLVTIYADLLYSDLFLLSLSMNPYRFSSITRSKLLDKRHFSPMKTVLSWKVFLFLQLLTVTVLSLSVALPVTVPITIAVSLSLSASLSVIIIMAISTPRFMTPTLFP